MKVLIACEESQTVCKAFRERGHEAYSCDILPCSGGRLEWHLQMDVFDSLRYEDWDFIGIHPPCTALTLSGNRHYAYGKPKYNERLAAIDWTVRLWKSAISRAKYVYLENPLGALSSDQRMPKPQIVQPYYFGDEFQKTTCLWLHNLPLLIHTPEQTLFEDKTHVSRGEMVTFKSGKIMPKWYADTPTTNSESNRTIRSKTYEGIAKAMAEQWG